MLGGERGPGNLEVLPLTSSVIRGTGKSWLPHLQMGLQDLPASYLSGWRHRRGMQVKVLGKQRPHPGPRLSPDEECQPLSAPTCLPHSPLTPAVPTIRPGRVG